jgi:hypothetical protein
MRTESNQVMWIGGVILAVVLVASPFVISQAQQNERGVPTVDDQKSDEQVARARAEVAKSVVGSAVLETISLVDPEWELKKAGFVGRGDNNRFIYVDMLLKNGDSVATISISEHDSPQEAEERFNGSRSHGASVPFNGFGDKGDKIVGQNGQLMAIRFRKSNFFVRISSRDQKTAERLADYVLRSLASIGVR